MPSAIFAALGSVFKYNLASSPHNQTVIQLGIWQYIVCESLEDVKLEHISTHLTGAILISSQSNCKHKAILSQVEKHGMYNYQETIAYQ